MRVLVEKGYGALTYPELAPRTGLTRMAIAYHYPSRTAFLRGLIAHIEEARGHLLDGAYLEWRRRPQDPVTYVVSAYWRLLTTPAFVAFAELERVGRTTPAVAELIAPAQAKFDACAFGLFARLVHAGDSPRLQASRDLGRFVVEGLVKASASPSEPARRDRVMAVLQQALRSLNRASAGEDLWVADDRDDLPARQQGPAPDNASS